MFWKKKTTFQIIADRLDSYVEMHIPDDVQSSAQALQNAIIGIAQSASMINNARATKLSEKGAIYFSDMLRGAYLIGYDFGQKHHPDLNTLTKINDFPPEVDEPIKEITQPLINVVLELIDISHAPGRITLLREDKERVKRDLVDGIFIVTTEYFFEGVKQAINPRNPYVRI